MLIERTDPSSSSGHSLSRVAVAHRSNASEPFQSGNSPDAPRLVRRLDSVTPPPLPANSASSRVPLPGWMQDDDELRAPADLFVWRSGETVEDEAEEGRSAVAATAGWLRKAQQNRRRQRLRSLTGWVTAVAIGGGIIAGAAYVFTGWVPDIYAVLDLGKRAFF